jgi:WD40 repeat protein
MNRFAFFPMVIAMAVLAAGFSDRAGARADDQAIHGHTLGSHKGSVLSVVFTNDGKTLVSSSRDHTIKVWDVASGKNEKTLTEHTADVYCVTFSHDGRLMASGSIDKRIILWDAKTYEPIRTLEGHTGAIREVAFSPDDKTLASGGEDKTFRLWDVETGKLKVTRTEHTASVKGVVYYPDGNTIVTASSDSTLRLWDAHTGEPKKVLKGHTNGVEFCALSPDAKQIFSGTGNIGEIIFWNAETGEIEKILPKAHGNHYGAEIDSGRYSPDGRWAVSGSKDRSDKFWDPKTFELLHTISENPGRTESMCFSPDGKTLATGYGGTDFSIKLWDVGALKE